MPRYTSRPHRVSGRADDRPDGHSAPAVVPPASECHRQPSLARRVGRCSAALISQSQSHCAVLSHSRSSIWVRIESLLVNNINIYVLSSTRQSFVHSSSGGSEERKDGHKTNVRTALVSGAFVTCELHCE